MNACLEKQHQCLCFVVNDLQIPETWFATLEGSHTLSMVLSGVLVAALATRFNPTNIVSVGLGLQRIWGRTGGIGVGSGACEKSTGAVIHLAVT